MRGEDGKTTYTIPLHAILLIEHQERLVHLLNGRMFTFDEITFARLLEYLKEVL